MTTKIECKKEQVSFACERCGAILLEVTPEDSIEPQYRIQGSYGNQPLLHQWDYICKGVKEYNPRDFNSMCHLKEVTLDEEETLTLTN